MLEVQHEPLVTMGYLVASLLGTGEKLTCIPAMARQDGISIPKWSGTGRVWRLM